MSFKIDPAGGPTGGGISNFKGETVAEREDRLGGPLARKFRRKAAEARTRKLRHETRHGVVAAVSARMAHSEAKAFEEAAEIAKQHYWAVASAE